MLPDAVSVRTFCYNIQVCHVLAMKVARESKTCCPQRDEAACSLYCVIPVSVTDRLVATATHYTSCVKMLLPCNVPLPMIRMNKPCTLYVYTYESITR